ncbi:MAG: class I SAM-dependent methyltransferase [Sideroxydans sp.]|jgi:SAM-dependent methyltransferase
MSERWQSYFESHGAYENNWLSTAVMHWGFHETLYGMIGRYCEKPSRILDVGSGPGWSEFYLSSMGYEVTGVDNEPTLVELAKRRAELLGVSAEFEVADAFDLSAYHAKFDLVFSCGVLEHFDREVTVRLLKEQALCAKYVLVEIPTRYTAYTGEITDERFYSVSELAKMVGEAGMDVVACFGYGDLVATPLQVFFRRVLPRAVWRWLQNKGFAYSIAVIGARK